MEDRGYVCGEIPFESNEDAIRRCSGWKEADEGDIEDGLMLKLHPKTSTALLKRVREVAKSFEQKIDCEMKLMMSYNDFRNDYIELHAAMEDGTVSCVDKAEDDRQQRNFPDLRVYFTPEEKQMLLDYYPTLSRKFIQYADSSYTEDDLERIRFLWTLILMEVYEGPRSIGKERRASKEMEAFLKVFYALPEDVRLKLYGFRDYEKNPFSEEDMLVRPDVVENGFLRKHSGIGDLSIMDDELYDSIRREGYFVQVTEIHLKDIDDVHMMCDFMNKLQEIERLAQAETDEPISEAQKDKRFDGSLASQWWDFADRWGQEERIPEMTIHEYHEQALKAALVDMNIIMNDGMNDGDLEFAADESSLWARLRFRLENGKYIYEIAQADV